MIYNDYILPLIINHMRTNRIITDLINQRSYRSLEGEPVNLTGVCYGTAARWLQLVTRGVDGPYLEIMKYIRRSSEPCEFLKDIDKAMDWLLREKQHNTSLHKRLVDPSNDHNKVNIVKKITDLEEKAKKLVDAEAFLQEVAINHVPYLFSNLLNKSDTFFRQSNRQDVTRSSKITSFHVQQSLGEFKNINVSYFNCSEKQQTEYFQALEYYFQEENCSPGIMISSASHATACFYKGNKWLQMDINSAQIVTELSSKELAVAMKKAHYTINTTDSFCFRIEFFDFFKDETHPLSAGIKKINQKHNCLTSDSIEKSLGFSFNIWILCNVLSHLGSNGISDKEVLPYCKNKYLLSTFVNKLFPQLKNPEFTLNHSFINDCFNPSGDDLESLLVSHKEITHDFINAIFNELNKILILLKETEVVHGDINTKNILWNNSTESLSLINFPEQPREAVHSEDKQAVLAIFDEIMYTCDFLDKKEKPDITYLPSEARAIYKQLKDEIPSYDEDDEDDEDDETKSTLSEQEKSFQEEPSEETEFDEEDEVTKRIKNA